MRAVSSLHTAVSNGPVFSLLLPLINLLVSNFLSFYENKFSPSNCSPFPMPSSGQEVNRFCGHKFARIIRQILLMWIWPHWSWHCTRAPDPSPGTRRSLSGILGLGPKREEEEIVKLPEWNWVAMFFLSCEINNGQYCHARKAK